MSLTKSDFNYELPSELIARVPIPHRTDSRLLTVDGSPFRHLTFSNLPQLLQRNDLLIVNDTKVIKARLRGRKESGGKVEVLIERIESTHIAVCQVKASRGLAERHVVHIGPYTARLLNRVGDLFRLSFSEPVDDVLEECGEVPLPTYVDRPPEDSDETRYQTVYAQEPGAVAAPTAGLHFTKELLNQLRDMGVQIEPITLHVGAGTFQPLRTERLEEVSLHSERYVILESTRHAIDSCSGRVVAVGTTVVRALEGAQKTNRDAGETDLFISPGFEFRVVDALITNFHLPESSLLMLVCAFAGHDRTMRAYQAAVQHKYRFFSYGDAMWCERNEV